VADLFDTISAWLLDQALSDDGIEQTLHVMCNRLVDGGVPLARVSVGRTILHPVIGLKDMNWDRETDQIKTSALSRSVIRTMHDVNAPFATMSRGESADVIADLTDPEQVARFPIFAELAANGITGYYANSRLYGTRQNIFGSIAENFRGGSVSFATKRFSGFSKSDLEGFERLITPLCICLRIADDKFVATEILGTYMGRNTGKKVLRDRSNAATASRSTAPSSIPTCAARWLCPKASTRRLTLIPSTPISTVRPPPSTNTGAKF
jgi:adenylate cyclase